MLRGQRPQYPPSWSLLPSARRDPCSLPRSMELPLRSSSLKGKAHNEAPVRMEEAGSLSQQGEQTALGAERLGPPGSRMGWGFNRALCILPCLSQEAPVPWNPWESRGHWMGRFCALSPGSHPGSPGHGVTRRPPNPGCPARLQRAGMSLLGPQGPARAVPAGQGDNCLQRPLPVARA